MSFYRPAIQAQFTTVAGVASIVIEMPRQRHGQFFDKDVVQEIER